MANYAWLVGCPSREIAARYDLSQMTVGPELEARYSIPLLWLACFEPGNALTVTEPASGSDGEPFMILCAHVDEVTRRLRRRQSSVIELVGPSFAPLYTEWVSFLQRRFPRQLLLRTEDLFSMDGYERAGLRLQAALRFMAVADAGGRIKERAAIEWFAALDGTFDRRPVGESPALTATRWRTHLSGSTAGGEETVSWPSQPSQKEIDFAATRPEMSLPEPGTAAAEDDALTRTVRRGVVVDSMEDGLRLAANKLAGNVPLGVDAPTKGLRKIIGGGGALLEVIRCAGLGLFFLFFGILFLWAGLRDQTNWKTLGFGAAFVGGSVWLLRDARRALRKWRAIARA
jgi:hypothetical protein